MRFRGVRRSRKAEGRIFSRKTGRAIPSALLARLGETPYLAAPRRAARKRGYNLARLTGRSLLKQTTVASRAMKHNAIDWNRNLDLLLKGTESSFHRFLAENPGISL